MSFLESGSWLQSNTVYLPVSRQNYYQQLSLQQQQQQQAAYYAAGQQQAAVYAAQQQYAAQAAAAANPAAAYAAYGYGSTPGTYGMMGGAHTGMGTGTGIGMQAQAQQQMQMAPAYGNPAYPAASQAWPQQAGYGQMGQGYGQQQQQQQAGTSGYGQTAQNRGPSSGGGAGYGQPAPPTRGAGGPSSYGPNDRGPNYGGSGGGFGRDRPPYGDGRRNFDRPGGSQPLPPSRARGPPYGSSANAVPPNLDASSPAFSSRSYADLVFPPSAQQSGSAAGSNDSGNPAAAAARASSPDRPRRERSRSPPLPRGPYMGRGPPPPFYDGRGPRPPPHPRDQWRDPYYDRRHDYGPPPPKVRENSTGYTSSQYQYSLRLVSSLPPTLTANAPQRTLPTRWISRSAAAPSSSSPRRRTYPTAISRYPTGTVWPWSQSWRTR